MATETRDLSPDRSPKPTPEPGGRGGARRTGRGSARRPAQYLREVAGELRKVIFPSRNDLVTYVIVVLIFVTAMTAIVAGLDYVFGKGILAVFG
jgi:preprotein translocase subunit SecE